MYYQHGDVIITKINKLPDNAKIVKPKASGNILADGESTGHAHVVDPTKTVMYSVGTALYLVVKERATVTHEEHKPIDIDEGVYEIGRVQEYDHFAEEARNVED